MASASATTSPAEKLRCTRRFKLLVVGSAHTGKGSLVKSLVASAIGGASADANDGAPTDTPLPDLHMQNSMDTTDVTDVTVAVPFVAAPAGSTVGSPAPPPPPPQQRKKNTNGQRAEESATHGPTTNAAMVDIALVSPSPATRSAVVASYRGAAAIIFVVRDGHPASMADVETFAEDALAAQGANDTVQYLAITGAKAPSASTPGPVSLEVLDAVTRILPRFGGIIDARRSSDDAGHQRGSHRPSPVLLSTSSVDLPTPPESPLGDDAAAAAESCDEGQRRSSSVEDDTEDHAPPVLVSIASTVVRLAEQGLPVLCNPVGPGARRDGDLDDEASKQGCCSCQ
jgi:hypothetical protein